MHKNIFKNQIFFLLFYLILIGKLKDLEDQKDRELRDLKANHERVLHMAEEKMFRGMDALK